MNRSNKKMQQNQMLVRKGGNGPKRNVLGSYVNTYESVTNDEQVAIFLPLAISRGRNLCL